jgi:hypothetical protein
VLVLTGVSGENELKRFGYQPDYILDHIGRFAEL